VANILKANILFSKCATKIVIKKPSRMKWFCVLAPIEGKILFIALSKHPDFGKGDKAIKRLE
jgi:hypothetical protein